MQLPRFTSFLDNLFKIDNNKLFEVIKEGFLSIFEDAGFYYTAEEAANFTKRVLEKYTKDYNIENIELCTDKSVCFDINEYGRYEILFNKIKEPYIEITIKTLEKGDREIENALFGILDHTRIINEEHLAKLLKSLMPHLIDAIERVSTNIFA
jgi:hypothetical protein